MLKAVRAGWWATARRSGPQGPTRSIVEHPVEGAGVVLAVVVLGLRLAGGVDEPSHLRRVLHAGCRLHPGGDIDAPGSDAIDRPAPVLRGQATGQDQPNELGRGAWREREGT